MLRNYDNWISQYIYELDMKFVRLMDYVCLQNISLKGMLELLQEIQLGIDQTKLRVKVVVYWSRSFKLLKRKLESDSSLHNAEYPVWNHS